MELFLLLSMGMSIVAFISVALNEAPTPSPIADHPLDKAFSLDSQLITSNQLQTLKLEDQLIVIEQNGQLIDLIDEPVEQPLELLATSEV